MSDAVADRDDLRLRVLTSWADLQPLREWWERWQSHTNQDRAQFELVCRLRPEVERPFVMVVDQGGQPQAMLVGRIEKVRFAPSVGYLAPFGVTARVLSVLHEGVLGCLGVSAADDAVDAMVRWLQAGQADAIAFHPLREGSALQRALAGRGGQTVLAPRWSVHREMILPPAGRFLDDKLSAKHRSQIRKRARELDEAFPGRLAWHWIDRCDDVDALCARIEAVARLTYQRRLGAGFFDSEEFRRRFALFFERGQMRVLLLETDGRPRAFWYGSVYGPVFHSSETGYDPALRDFEVGTLMLVRLGNALADEGVARFDFGIGDAPYKQRFGDRSWREAPAWLFAPTARGWAMRSLQQGSQRLDASLRRVLERSGLTARVKSIWRRTGAARQGDRPTAAKDGRRPGEGRAP